MRGVRASLEYVIYTGSHAVAEALYRSIRVDLDSLPEGCSGSAKHSGAYLTLKLECKSVNRLRALSNSFIGVLIFLLEVAGELLNVGENSTTRGPATNYTVPNA